MLINWLGFFVDIFFSRKSIGFWWSNVNINSRIYLNENRNIEEKHSSFNKNIDIIMFSLYSWEINSSSYFRYICNFAVVRIERLLFVDFYCFLVLIFLLLIFKISKIIDTGFIHQFIIGNPLSNVYLVNRP